MFKLALDGSFTDFRHECLLQLPFIPQPLDSSTATAHPSARTSSIVTYHPAAAAAVVDIEFCGMAPKNRQPAELDFPFFLFLFIFSFFIFEFCFAFCHLLFEFSYSQTGNCIKCTSRCQEVKAVD